MRHRKQGCIRKLDLAIQDLRKAKYAVKHRRIKRAVREIRLSLIDIGKTFRYLMKLK